MGTVGWSRTSCLLVISEAPLPRGPRRHGGERGDRTPAGRHPGNGLAGRPITSLAALHRGHDGTRTRGLRLDRAASTPAAPRDHERAYPERDSNPQHPRSGRGASSSWTTRAWWTDPGSNRAREACKATLHTSAPPKSQRSDSNRLSPRYEGGAGPDLLRWHRYPRPDSNRHWTAPQTVASYRWATRACSLGAEDSNLHAPASEAGVLPVRPAPNRPAGGRVAAHPPAVLSARRGRPTTEPAG